MDSTSNVVSVDNTNNMDSTSNVVSVDNTNNMDSTSNAVSVSKPDNMDSANNMASVSNASQMEDYWSLHQVYLSSYRYTDALSCVKKYHYIGKQLGIKFNEEEVYRTLGMIQSVLNECDIAISNNKKSIDIAKDTGNKYCEMKAFLNLSSTYAKIQQYDEAVCYAKEGIRIIQEISTKKATEMDDLNCLDVAGIYTKDASLGPLAAEAYFTLGQAEAYLELYEDALDSFQKCAAIATEIGQEMTKLKSFYGIAMLFQIKSQWNDVVEFSRKYIEKMSLFCCKKMEIEAYLRLATALWHINHYEEAVIYGKKCIETIGDSQDADCCTARGASLAVLGLSYCELDKYDEAINCGKKYLEIAAQIGSKEAELEARYILSNTYNRLHQIESGVNHATTGMAIAKELNNEMAMESFRSLLSGFYSLMGMNDKAFSLDPGGKSLFEVPTCLRQELEALVKAVKAGDVSQQAFFQFRLYNYHKSKYQFERAMNCIKAVKELQPCCSEATLFSYAPMAELYIGMKKYEEGLQYCEGGLREVAGCRNIKIRLDFFFYISQLYAANNKFHLAEKYLKEAIQCFETFYQSLGSNDGFKMSTVDRYNECFRFLSLVYLQTNRSQEALLVLDKCRARALIDILVDSYGIQENKEAREVKFSDVETLVSSNQFAILYYSICGFGNALAFLVGYNYFEASVQNLCFDEKKYQKLIDKMFDEIELREVNCEDRILDIDPDIKHQKQEEEEEDDEREAVIFQQRKRNFVLHKKKILMYDNENQRPATALEFLYCLIIGEGRSSIKQSEIIFIPDGSLCKIPFAALQDPDTGKYLSETKRIRLAPSLATLKHFEDFPTNQTSDAKPLIIGNPLVGKVMLDGEEQDIQGLLGAQAEAIVIADKLGVKPVIGEAATKQAVLEKLQQGVSVVHIAAHGILSKATIVLAPSPEVRAAKTPDEEDYMLTMADVQQAKVRAQLVVLSCCHSGRGEIRAEGVVGMCRAFLASGARAVVASLWAIDDDATLEFMTSFYGNLKNGKSASTSLQLTMNEMRNTSKYTDPKYWAPFFIIGDDITLKSI